MTISNYHLQMADVVSNAFSDTKPDQPDGVDFAWWSDSELHEFISNPTNLEEMSEEALNSLVYEVSRRVDARIEEFRQDD